MKERNKRKNSKKENAITLIALVVTIVVLLILAGISINLVLGDNGIVRKAQEAKLRYEKSAMIEQIDTAFANCEADYIVQTSNDVNVVSKKEYYKENLNKYFTDKLNLINCEELGDENLFIKFTYDNNENILLFNIENSSKNLLNGGESLFNNVTAKNYGDFCQYSVSINNKKYDSWKIFYKDDNNVYLIMNEYAQVNALEKNFKASWMTPTSTNAGYSGEKTEYVSLLTDTSLWSKFCDSSYAESAIGASTLDMWVNSWNSKYGINGVKSSKDKYCHIYANKTANDTYYIGYSTESTKNHLKFSYTMNEDAETDSELVEDSLYFMDNDIYMIAALSENEFNPTGDSRWDNLIFPYFTIAYRTILARNGNTVGYRYRPVVCLKNNLNAYYYEDDSGVHWILKD